MTKELVWFILPISAALWMAGGTWNTAIRRIGNSALYVVTAMLYLGFSWSYVIMGLLYFGAFTLPFTLIGNNFPDHPFNYIWVYILGAIYGLPALIIGYQTNQLDLSLSLILVPSIAVGLFTYLSNNKSTAKYFQWKFCEFIFGTAVAIPPAMLISLS